MLKHITLTNFQKHRHFQATFSDGLNLVVGENWSGKSTVQRAVLYALFGASAVPTSADTLTTVGETGMQVVLAFGQHVVTRGRNKATLEGPAGIEATGQTSVTARVEELLGTTAKNFLAFHVARQDEAGALLSLGAPKLASYINAVTGVDLVDMVLERAKEQLIQVKSDLALADDRVTRYGEMVDQRSRVAGELQSAETGVSQLDQLVQQRQVVAQTAQAESARLSQARQEGEALSYQRTAQEGVIATLHRQIAGLGDPPPAVDDLEILELDAQLKDDETLRARRQAAQQDVETLQNRVANAASSLETARAAIVRLSQEDTDQEAAQAAVDAARDVWHRADFEVDRLNQSIQGGFCPTCQRPYETDGIHDLQATKDALQAAEATRQRALESCQASAARLAAVRQTVQARDDAVSREEQWSSYLTASEQSLAQAEQELQALPKACLPEVIQQLEDQLQQARAALQTYRDFQARQNSVLSLLAQAQKTLEDLPPLPAAYPSREEVEQALESSRILEKRVHETRIELSQVTAHAQALARGLAGLESVKAEMELALDQDRKSLGRKQQLEQLSKYLRDNRDRFSASVWQQLLDVASAFIWRATGGDVTALHRTQDGEFQYVERDVTFPVELASGMQRAILGTGLKLAMGAALGGPADFLLLDEVSASASDENSLTLTYLLAQTGQQVMLISHRSADTAVADSVIQL